MSDLFANLQPSEIWVSATRTDASTGAESSTRVQLSLRPAPGRLWILGIEKGGVTGYEAFYLDQDWVKSLCELGWMANAGTPHRWDTLYIPASSMQFAFQNLCPDLYLAATS